MPVTIEIKTERVSVDLLLFRKYGVRGQSMVEETLVLNHGLADLGAYLPLGSTVVLPDLPVAENTYPEKPISLFS